MRFYYLSFFGCIVLPTAPTVKSIAMWAFLRYNSLKMLILPNDIVLSNLLSNGSFGVGLLKRLRKLFTRDVILHNIMVIILMREIVMKYTISIQVRIFKCCNPTPDASGNLHILFILRRLKNKISMSISVYDSQIVKFRHVRVLPMSS